MVIVMKKCVLVFLFGWMTAMAVAQVPQFSANDFEGWIYTNPSTELNQSNILGDVTDAALMQRADVNHDSEVTLADVNDVIDMMLW